MNSADGIITWSNKDVDVEITAPFEYVLDGYDGYTPNITTHVELVDQTDDTKKVTVYDLTVTRDNQGKVVKKDDAALTGTTTSVYGTASYNESTGKITLPLEKDGKYKVTVYVSDEAGNTTKTVSSDSAEYFVDKTAPTDYDVTISNTSVLRNLLYNVGFKFFGKPQQTVTLSYNTQLSGLQSAEYIAVPLKNNAGKTALEQWESDNKDATTADTLKIGLQELAGSGGWTKLENATDSMAVFNVDKGFVGVYFFYLQDNAGNYVLFSTDGMAIEGTAPQDLTFSSIRGYKTSTDASGDAYDEFVQNTTGTDANSQDGQNTETTQSENSGSTRSGIYKSASYTFTVKDAESGIDHAVVTMHDASEGVKGKDTTFTFKRTGDGESVAQWNKEYNAATAKLKLTATEDSANTDEMIEGAGKTYTGTINCLQSGIYTATVKAYDCAGNEKVVSDNVPVTVDNATPKLNVKTQYEDGTWTTKDVSLNLSSSEKLITVPTYWYTIDNSAVAYPVDQIQDGTTNWGTVADGTPVNSTLAKDITFSKDTNHTYKFYLAIGAKSEADGTLKIAEGAAGTNYTYLVSEVSDSTGDAAGTVVSHNIKIQKTVPQFYGETDYKVYNYAENKDLTGSEDGKTAYGTDDIAEKNHKDWYNQKLALALDSQKVHVATESITNSDEEHNFAPITTSYKLWKEGTSEPDWKKLTTSPVSKKEATTENINLTQLIDSIANAKNCDGTWNLKVQVKDAAGNIATSGKENVYKTNFQVDTTEPEVKSVTYDDVFVRKSETSGFQKLVNTAKEIACRIFKQSGKTLKLDTNYDVSGRQRLYIQFRDAASDGSRQAVNGELTYSNVDGSVTLGNDTVKATTDYTDGLPRNTWIELPSGTTPVSEISNLKIQSRKSGSDGTTIEAKDFAGTIYVTAIDNAGNRNDGWFDAGLDLDDTAPEVNLKAVNRGTSEDKQDEVLAATGGSEETPQTAWMANGDQIAIQAVIKDADASKSGKAERLDSYTWSVTRQNGDQTETVVKDTKVSVNYSQIQDGNYSDTTFTEGIAYDVDNNLYVSALLGKDTFKQDGIYTVKVTAEDKAGNKSTTSEIQVRVDTTAATGIAVNLTGKGEKPVTKNVVNRGITSDELKKQQKQYLNGLTKAGVTYDASISGAKSVQAEIYGKATEDDKEFSLVQTVTASDNGTVTLDKLNDELTTALESKEVKDKPIYYLKITVTDQAGNVATAYTDVVYADETQPTVEVEGYSLKKWTSDTVTLTVKAEDDGSGIEAITFDGTTWIYATDFGTDHYQKSGAASTADGDSQEARSSFTFKKDYAENAENLKIQVRDRAGNVSELQAASANVDADGNADESSLKLNGTEFSINKIDKAKPKGGELYAVNGTEEKNASEQFTEDNWYNKDQTIRIKYTATKADDDTASAMDGTTEYVHGI